MHRVVSEGFCHFREIQQNCTSLSVQTRGLTDVNPQFPHALDICVMPDWRAGGFMTRNYACAIEL